MTMVTLVSGCGNAYPGDGRRDGGGQGGRWVSSTPTGPHRSDEDSYQRYPHRKGDTAWTRGRSGPRLAATPLSYDLDG